MTSAAVLVALALLIGGFAWMATGSRADNGDTAVLTHSDQGDSVGFVALSPHDIRIKNNIEKGKRELARIRQTGKEVSPNTFMVEDENGEPTYYHGDLIEGRGRFGEKIYAMSQLKQIPTLPIKKARTVPGQKLGPKRNIAKAAAPVDAGASAVEAGSTGTGGTPSDADVKVGVGGAQGAGPK